MARPPDVVVSPFAKPPAQKIAPGSVAGALMVVLLLGTGAAVLGGARPWILLPMFGLTALLLLLQVGRLAAGPGIGLGRLVRPDAVDAFALLFFVYAGIRYKTAPIEYTARMEWMTILSGGIVFWTARYGLARAGHGLIILWGFLLIAFGEALFSIWLSFHPEFHPWGESLHLHYWPRFIGSFGCPNHYGAFLYMGTFAALSLALFMPGKLPVRLALLLMAVTMSFGVAFSLSRGSWIGFFMGFVVFWLFCVRSGKASPKIAAGAVGGLVGLASVWAAFSPDVQGRIAELTSHLTTFGGNQALDGYIRIVLAHDAWRIIGDYFWFGSGPGTFAFLHPRYQDAKYSTLAVFPHDDYLNTWSDYGFVGFLIALGFVLSVAVTLFLRARAKRANGNGSSTASWGRRALLATGLSSWTALMFHEALDFNFHIPVCAFAGLTLAGLALRASGGEASATYEGKWPKRIARIGAVAGVVLAYVFVSKLTQTAKGYYAFHEIDAQKGDAAFPVADASLSEALLADPNAWEAQALLADYCRAESVRSSDEKEKVELGQRAIAAYLQAIELNPYDDGLLVRLGLAYDGMERYTEGYIAYAKAVARRPYNGYYHLYLGLHFWRMGGEGNLARAEKEFETGRNCPYGDEESFDYQKKLAQFRQEQAARALQLQAQPPPASASASAASAGASPEQAPAEENK